MKTFLERLEARIQQVDSLACVGLDPVIEQMPAEFAASKNPLSAWSAYVVEQTHRYVCAFKPNLAFYEAEGRAGIKALEQTLRYLRSQHPDIPVIGDAKRGDVGSSSEAYARSLFEHLGLDAVTLNPYLGRDALEPFLRCPERGCIIVCRTSNPGADDFQNLKVEGRSRVGDTPLWHHVLRKVAEEWNTRGNCLAVVGATRPDDLRAARRITGDDMTFLAPGVGAQGGDLAEAVSAGVNSQSRGVIVSCSRSVASAPDPATAAAELRDRINEARLGARRRP